MGKHTFFKSTGSDAQHAIAHGRQAARLMGDVLVFLALYPTERQDSFPAPLGGDDAAPVAAFV